MIILGNGESAWGCCSIATHMSKKQRPLPVETIEEIQNDLPYDKPIGKKDYKQDLESQLSGSTS